MQKFSKDLLREILTIIQYAKDKEKFVEEFEAMNYMQAMANMIDTLPFGVKQLVQIKYSDQQWVKEHISEEKLQQEIVRVGQEELSLLLQRVSPTLNNLQKEKIQQLFLQ
jgi:hypothetical protein